MDLACAMALIPAGLPYATLVVLSFSSDTGADVNVFYSVRVVSTIESVTTDFFTAASSVRVSSCFATFKFIFKSLSWVPSATFTEEVTSTSVSATQDAITMSIRGWKYPMPPTGGAVLPYTGLTSATSLRWELMGTPRAGNMGVSIFGPECLRVSSAWVRFVAITDVPV